MTCHHSCWSVFQVEIGESDDNGYGLRATRDIQVGDDPIPKPGDTGMRL